MYFESQHVIVRLETARSRRSASSSEVPKFAPATILPVPPIAAIADRVQP